MSKLFQTQCLPWQLALALSVMIGLFACSNEQILGPEGYDMAAPAEREMGKVLTEISGLNYNTDSNTLLAISDNEENIFEINLRAEKLKDYVVNFYKKADYEELVKIKDTVYVMISDGTLVAVPANGQVSDSSVRAYPFPSQDKNDFESLYHDGEANALIMICKECEVEKGKEIRTAYKFDLATKRFDSTAFYTISQDSVKQLLKNEDADFKPSAAAIHPIEKRLYILASAGQLLVITDLKGAVQEAYNLNPDTHPQAEGIAFSPAGTMYISNEGKYGKATLQVFPYKPNAKAATKPKKKP